METRSILPPGWDVPKVFRERLGDRPGRQRAMFADGHLLLVLHHLPGPDDLERRGRFIWRRPDGSWSSSDLGGGVASLAKHINEYAEAIHRFEQREEKASSSLDYFAVLEGVAPICRAVAHLHQTLQEARKMVPEDRTLINFRDQSYDLDRTADLLYTTAKNSLDFEIAKRAEEESRASRQMASSAHRLNVLAAFFFPLATVSAVFGVNMAHGVEQVAAPFPFILMVAGGLLCGLLLAMFITRPTGD